jgi:general secretion pathway protein D
LRSLVEQFASTNFSRSDDKIISSDAAASVIAIPNQSPKIPGQINFRGSSSPLVSVTGIFNSLQCNVVIQVLEQHVGSDLMSAPKLTILSGKTAKLL